MPGSRRTANRSRIPNLCYRGRGRFGQFATQQRFHHDNRDILGRRIVEAFGTSLVGLIHVVVLDLAKIPVVRIDHLFEYRDVVVE